MCVHLSLRKRLAVFSLLLLQVKFLSEDKRTNLQIIYVFRVEKVTQSILAATSESPVNTQDGRFLFVDGCSHLIYILHLGKAITANVSRRC